MSLDKVYICFVLNTIGLIFSNDFFKLCYFSAIIKY